MTEPRILTLRDRGSAGEFRSMVLDTPRAPIEVRLYEAPDAISAALMVGGAGGGFDSPAHDLYEALARDRIVRACRRCGCASARSSSARRCTTCCAPSGSSSARADRVIFRDDAALPLAR